MAESQRFGHSEEFISAFIVLLKQQKSLWMVKSKEYSNRIMKNRAYEELLNLCKSYNEDCDIDFVKRKIKSLRDSFRKEYKKVRATEKSGAITDDIYEPNLWYYKLLLFLKDQEVPRMGRDSDTQVEISNDGCNEVTENESRAEAESIPTENQCDDEISNYREQETSTTDKVLPRKQKLKNGRAPAINKKNSVEKAYELLSKPDDEYDIIGQSIAIKLRKMSDRQALHCEKVINEALYKGIMEQLNEESHVASSSLEKQAVTSFRTTEHHSYPQDYYNPQQNNSNHTRTNATDSPAFIHLEPPRSETFFNINSILRQN